MRELSTGDGVIRMAASTGREALRETLSAGLPTSRASSKPASICSNCARMASKDFLTASLLPEDNASSIMSNSRARKLGVSLSSVATDVITRESSVATYPWPFLMQDVDNRGSNIETTTLTTLHLSITSQNIGCLISHANCFQHHSEDATACR